MLLIQIAQTKNKSISVVAESLPHLRKGAIRDFLNIMKMHRYYNEANHNKTENIYNFDTGAYIEFFGADDPTKLRGPRRDILFMNEANNMSFQTFEQLEVRTKNTIYIDYNPTHEFWAHTDVISKRDHDFKILTYKDNEALEPSIIESIESRKDRPNWWKVYGLGEIGTKEGQIYPEWKQIDRVPNEARLMRRWLDFGYTNHPTAIGSVYRLDDGYILDEVEYRTGMNNTQIADKLKSLDDPRMLVVADSAEPKSIDEIKSQGINIIGAVKGQGSVNFGIDIVSGLDIKVTKRSVNIIKENRNYLWKLDKDGQPLNTPEPVFDHHMDGIRYALSDLAAQSHTPAYRASWV